MNKQKTPSRGRPRAFDRDAALGRAMRLFWQHGYETTSISELAEAMAINPPSLYAAFSDKRQLFLEAVDRYEASYGSFAEAALAEEVTAEGAVRRLLLEAVDSYTDPAIPRGCMVVSAATNCSADSIDITDDLRKRRRASERAIRKRIAKGIAEGDVRADADPDALAGFIAALIQGLSAKARDGVPRKQLERIVAQALEGWPGAKRIRRN